MNNEVTAQPTWCRYTVIAICLGLILVESMILISAALHFFAHTVNVTNPSVEIATIASATAILLMMGKPHLWKEGLITTCIAAVFIVSLVTMSQHFFDHHIVARPMHFLSAFNFLFIAISLSILSIKNKARWIFQLFVIIVYLGALLSLSGYLFEVNFSYPIAAFTQMNIETSFVFLLLGIAILLTKPNVGFMRIFFENSTSGKLLRRITPVVFIGFAVVAYSINKGLRFGLYDDSFGDILTLIVNMGLLIALLWANTLVLKKEEKNRDHVQSALEESEMIFTEFADNINEVFWKASPDLKNIFYLSPAFEEIWGIPRATLYDHSASLLDSVHPDDQAKVRNSLSFIRESSSSTISIDFRIICPDHSIKYIYTHAFQQTRPKENSNHILGIASDITLLEHTKQRIAAQQDILRQIESGIPLKKLTPLLLKSVCTHLDWDQGELWTVTPDTDKLEKADSWKVDGTQEKNLQLTNSSFKLGEGIPGLVWQDKKSLWNADLAQDPYNTTATIQVRTVAGVPVLYKGNVLGVLMFFSQYRKPPDTNMVIMLETIGLQLGEYINHQAAEAKIDELAGKDELTGLMNRTTISQQLNEQIKAHPKSPIAVIAFNIDKFKLINEAMGFESGDMLLKLIAERLSHPIFFKDEMLARLTADKFILIPTKIQDQNQALEFIFRLYAAFKEYFYVNDKPLLISISIGISFYPKDGLDANALLKNADLALSEAKKAAGNSHQFFNETLSSVSSNKFAIEYELRDAINKNEFVLYYQPKVDLKTGMVCGAEALIRWQHPTKGLLQPGSFMPDAEECGLTIPITEWIIRDVFNQIIHHKLTIPIAINISASHLKPGYNLDGYLRQMLQGFHLNPASVELEITESALMEDTDLALTILANLKSLGFCLTLDDFGTKFSSLSYLKDIAVDKIKLDKSFIDNIPGSNDNVIIIHAILGLFRALGKRVVAEGVENVEQLRFLVKEGCDEIQGYYFSKPLLLEEMKQLLVSKKKWEIPEVN